MSNFIFYLIIFSFTIGIFIGEKSIISLNFFLLLFLLLISSLFFKNKILFLIIIFIVLGIFRINLVKDNKSLDDEVGNKIFGEVQIISEADIRENNTHYLIDYKNQNIKITMGHYPRLNYGDRIYFEGKLDKPKNFENENKIEFDYINYLGKDDIYYLIYYPQIKVILQNIFSWKGLIFKVKNFFLKQINSVLPSPHSSLSAGILLGVKQSLGKELLDDFRRVGLIHIVVLSGYNVTLIANFILKAFSFLPRQLSFIFGSLSILIFAVMTGASATTVRASIMATVGLSANYFYRNYRVDRALFLAGFLMVFHNPKILFYDPGFQLSFMATIGLIYISPLISNRIRFISEKFQLREIISATIATQITVLPLLVKMTGEVSIISLLVNILVLPIIPFAMLFSFISGIVSFLDYFALPIHFLTYLSLEYVFIMTDIFSDLPFAVIKLN